MNQTITNASLFSEFHFYHNSPVMSTLDPWRPVYQFTGISARVAKGLLLSKKRQLEENERVHNLNVATLIQREGIIQKALGQEGNKDVSAATLARLVGTNPHAPFPSSLFSNGAALVLPEGQSKSMAFRRSVLGNTQHNMRRAAVINAQPVLSLAGEGGAMLTPWQHMQQCAEFGLTDIAARYCSVWNEAWARFVPAGSAAAAGSNPIVDPQASPFGPSLLSSAEYGTAIEALSAPMLSRWVYLTKANYDVTMVPKLMGTLEGGSYRCQQAMTLMDQHSEMCRRATTFYASRRPTAAVGATPAATKVTALHFNALMSVYMNSGFSQVQKIHGALYDAMGKAKVPPNARTYELVLRSLALCGVTKEVKSILTFLKSTCPEKVTSAMEDSLLIAYKTQKDYDGCDQVWKERVDRMTAVGGGQGASGVSVMTPETADLYLRSIIDRSYVATSKDLNKFGEVHSVEKKRIPLVLTEMERIGLPKSSLTPPVIDECEDALRKFVIPRRNFYEWGRAVKQFDYINFRREHGLIHDMKEINPTVMQGPSIRPWSSNAKGPQNPAPNMPYATTEAPGWIMERPSWQQPALSHLLNKTEIREHMHDTKGGEKFFVDRSSIHARSHNWMTESPQTRYDQLYGASNPNIPKIGIRQHLLGAGATGGSGAYPGANGEEVAMHDSKVLRSTLSSARRARLAMDRQRTHRTES